MRTFMLGCCVGLILGVIGATVALSPAQSPSQPWNPYAPGSWNSSTNLYQGMITQDADNYLNSRPRLRDPYPTLGSPCPY